jgi:hypothetical protein
MSKTVIQALRDDIIYAIPTGKVENIVINRFGSLEAGGEEYTQAVSETAGYKGAKADCLYSLLQAVNFSEAGMSVGALTDAQRKSILKQANDLYGEIGEDPKDDPLNPTVEILS